MIFQRHLLNVIHPSLIVKRSWNDAARDWVHQLPIFENKQVTTNVFFELRKEGFCCNLQMHVRVFANRPGGKDFSLEFGC